MTTPPNEDNTARLDSRMFLAAVRRRLDERSESEPEHPTSWTLIRAAAGTDEEARTRFVERYLPVVRTYIEARWRQRPYFVDLEDAVQEVFLQCFQDDGALGRVDPERGSFSGFLYGVVRRVAQRFETRRARQLNRQNPGSFHPDHQPIDEASLSVVFDRAWAASVVREAGDLNRARGEAAGGDRQRRVELLRLRFQEGKPIREIAAAWGEDPKRVHWAYARAREEFREAMCAVLVERGYRREVVTEECRRILAALG